MLLEKHEWDDVILFYKTKGMKFSVFRKSSSTIMLNDKGKKLHSLVLNKDALFRSKNDVTTTMIRRLMIDVTNDVNKYLLSNNMGFPELNKPIQVRKKNIKYYSLLNDKETFLTIDINHNYWYNAFMSGIISEKTYNKYIYKDFKVLRNISISRLTNCKSKTYYLHNGVEYTIEENRDIYKEMYSFIRNYTNNVIYELLQKINNEYFWYNVDCISVPFDHKETVINHLEQFGYEYKIERCTKIDNMHYSKPGSYIKKI